LDDNSFFDDDMEDFEPVIEADVNFLRALETLDLKTIMSCWSEFDRITMLFPGVELARGREEVEDAWATVAKNTSRLNIVLHPLSVMRLGDLGWTFLSGSMVSTHGDETLTVEVFVTNIYRREEDGWKLMHHHAAPGPHQPAYLEQRLN
jgi:ketosteroid isomerase-like protein